MNDVIKYAYNIEYRLFDTAQMYHNEDALGNAIQANLIDRNDIFLISKVENRLSWCIFNSLTRT